MNGLVEGNRIKCSSPAEKEMPRIIVDKGKGGPIVTFLPIDHETHNPFQPVADVTLFAFVLMCASLTYTKRSTPVILRRNLQPLIVLKGLQGVLAYPS